MIYDELLSRLEAVHRTGGQVLARCPAHDDRKSSLAVRQAEDGRVLVHCHAGCATEAVCEALGLSLRDLMPERSIGRNGSETRQRGRMVATYDYRDETGALLFQVVRYEPKDFRQRRPDGQGGWLYDLNGCRRVLYRLPEVLAAIRDGHAVWIVEGEKDVNNLAHVGLCATTKPCGGSDWRPEYSETLRGAKIVLIPDNDVTGRRYMREVASHILPVAASVKLVRLPGVAPKGDVSDWLAAGGTRDALVRLARQCPPLRRQTVSATLRQALMDAAEQVRDLAQDAFLPDDALKVSVKQLMREALRSGP